MIADPERAPTLMRMTAAKSVRVARPVYHVVVSWRHDEAPTPDLMRQVADTTCRDLGLADHQRLYIAHHDTRNPHVHIVVNRVHPETGVAWVASNDYRRIEQSLARQARELGLDVVPGRHNTRDMGTAPKRSRDGAYQKARREETAPPRDRWHKEQIDRLRQILRPLFDAAGSWTALETALADHGLTLAAKGQGLVIANATGEMKLSDLGAGIRLTGLQARFGQAWAEIHPSEVSERTPESSPSQPSRRRRRDRSR